MGPAIPGVEVRLAEGTDEIELRGPNVFGGYWERPDATDAHEHGGHLGLQDLLLRGDRQIAGFATSAQTREQQVKTVLAATYGARYMEVSSVRTRSSPSTASLGGSSV